MTVYYNDNEPAAAAWLAELMAAGLIPEGTVDDRSIADVQPADLAVCGVVLNNYKMRACFVLWLASNAMSAGLHVHADLWSLAGRDAVFLALAVHGWLAWGRKDRR